MTQEKFIAAIKALTDDAVAVHLVGLQAHVESIEASSARVSVFFTRDGDPRMYLCEIKPADLALSRVRSMSGYRYEIHPVALAGAERTE